MEASYSNAQIYKYKNIKKYKNKVPATSKTGTQPSKAISQIGAGPITACV